MLLRSKSIHFNVFIKINGKSSNSETEPARSRLPTLSHSVAHSIRSTFESSSASVFLLSGNLCHDSNALKRCFCDAASVFYGADSNTFESLIILLSLSSASERSFIAYLRTIMHAYVRNGLWRRLNTLPNMGCCVLSRESTSNHAKIFITKFIILCDVNHQSSCDGSWITNNGQRNSMDICEWTLN